MQHLAYVIHPRHPSNNITIDVLRTLRPGHRHDRREAGDVIAERQLDKRESWADLH